MKKEMEETLSTIFSQMLISLSLTKMHKWTNALTLSTNSINYIKQFDISW